MSFGWTVAKVVVTGSLLALGVAGCSSKSSSPSSTSPAGSGNDGNNGNSGNNGSSGAPSTSSGGAAPVGPTDPYNNGMMAVGQLNNAPQTKLPALPTLSNVVALQGDDGASITFDPVDGALDYRVYPLPADGDITVGAGGAVVVHNATYRCAGDREAPAAYADAEPQIGGEAIHTQVDQQMVGNYLRTLAGATLGYVYTQPGTGLVPVYALGESDPNADSTCYFGRWAASRVKKYTTSGDERTMLLKAFVRDDGVAFYVPATADGTTTNINFEDQQIGTPYQTRFYFPDGPETAAHPNKALAFPVLTAAAAGTQPLMRVFYQNSCGWSHDELAVGKERFNRIYHQGDKLPSFTLNWSGISPSATLVVEALDSGCPYQGYMAPQAFPTITVPFGDMNVVHQPWLTMDNIRAASSTGEVFVNGQHEATNQPKAIARSFISVKPQPHPKMDFFDDFAPDSTPETFTTVDCGSPDGNCYQTWRQQSPTFDQMFINAESGSVMGTGLYAFAPILGEWWVSYADVAADTNGKYRLTAVQKATMSDSKFLHVTMEVDAYTTSRRYPQILISDADVPVQYGLDKGHTIILQPRAVINTSIDFPDNYELQLCKLRTWDVNNQCPVYDLYHSLDSTGKTTRLNPNDEFGEHTSVEHRVLFDIYASTNRAYVFLDGAPYACADLPADAAPTGPVTVTWGDVLYHSAVDHTFAFHAAHMQVEQRRHFDNLGFSSGLSAPTWDESRLPCAAPIAL
jgi:hypothetical protein